MKPLLTVKLLIETVAPAAILNRRKFAVPAVAGRVTVIGADSVALIVMLELISSSPPVSVMVSKPFKKSDRIVARIGVGIQNRLPQTARAAVVRIGDGVDRILQLVQRNIRRIRRRAADKIRRRDKDQPNASNPSALPARRSVRLMLRTSSVRQAAGRRRASTGALMLNDGLCEIDINSSENLFTNANRNLESGLSFRRRICRTAFRERLPVPFVGASETVGKTERSRLR